VDTGCTVGGRELPEHSPETTDLTASHALAGTGMDLSDQVSLVNECEAGSGWRASVTRGGDGRIRTLPPSLEKIGYILGT
jgi:hypothetical protein